MNIGWLVFSRMRNAVRKLCGQVSGVPSGLADQAYARVNAPISPPPARKSPEVGRLIFSIQDDRWRVQPNWQPELNRLSQSQQTGGPAFGSKYILSGRNKIAGARASAALTIGHAMTLRHHAMPQAPYFIRPAAVSARVMTAPTSIPRRRGSCGGSGRRPDSGPRLSVVSGQSTAARSGTCAGAGAAIIVATSFGASAGTTFFEALAETTFFEAEITIDRGIHSVRPKKFAM